MASTKKDMRRADLGKPTESIPGGRKESKASPLRRTTRSEALGKKVSTIADVLFLL